VRSRKKTGHEKAAVMAGRFVRVIISSNVAGKAGDQRDEQSRCARNSSRNPSGRISVTARKNRG
jgi:hypothetical protein